jgi:hypothetical protein
MWLGREGDRLVIREQLDLAETIDVNPELEPFREPISAFAASDGLLVIIDREHRTTLIRVSTTGSLTVTDRVELDERVAFPQILDTGADLLVAGWRRSPEPYARALFFAFFDRERLRPTSEWTRVSAVDQISGAPPSLFYSEGRLLLSWVEHGGGLRTRCIRTR